MANPHKSPSSDEQRPPLTDDWLTKTISRAVDGVFVRMLDCESQLIEVEGIENVQTLGNRLNTIATGDKRCVTLLRIAGSIQGSVYLYMNRALANELVCQFLDLEPGTTPDSVSSTLKEISNMIVGDLKSRLCGLGYRCTLKIPIEIKDFETPIENTQVSHKKIYRFNAQDEDFALLVYVEPGKNTP
jgi:chemotaxis protein CheX